MTTPPITPATGEQIEKVNRQCEIAVETKHPVTLSSEQVRSTARVTLSLIARIREMEATVSKLPKTSDGVLLIDCERLYCPSGHPVERIDDGRCWCERCEHGVGGAGRSFDETECYSTGDAAIAARKENTGGTP